MAQKRKHKWAMVVDIDKCTGCQACVVACQAENNVPINTEDLFHQKRAFEWIRVERYWDVPDEYRGSSGVDPKPEETPLPGCESQVHSYTVPALRERALRTRLSGLRHLSQ